VGGAASSVLPPVQNLLLAARALGVGSVLTTLHPQVMARVYAMFEVPEEATFHCCIPLGYPRGRFGPTQRLPTSQTTFWNRWGQRPPW
jgi:nitroreductase